MSEFDAAVSMIVSLVVAGIVLTVGAYIALRSASAVQEMRRQLASAAGRRRS